MKFIRFWTLGVGLISLIGFSPAVWAQEVPDAGSELTLDEAVQIALKNHPSIMGARSTLQAERRVELEMIRRVLEETRWNRREAA
jgi:hypothetical protein